MEKARRIVSKVKGILGMLTLSGAARKNAGLALEQAAQKRPDQVLFYFEERHYTYRQANDLSNRYANLFLSLGFKKGDTIALIMENRPEYLIVHAGLAKIGVVPALVNTNLRGQVLAHALNIVSAKAAIVGQELSEQYIESKADIKLSDPGLVFVEAERKSVPEAEGMQDIQPFLDKQPVTLPVTGDEMTLDDTLEYIYTSGTTGMPKATILKHKKWFQLGMGVGGMSFAAQPGEVQYMCLPLYHNSGINIAWPSTLLWGGTMAIRRKFSASNFWDDVRKYNASLFIYVGELCRYLNNQPQKSNDGDNPLRFILGNGMRGEYWEAFQKRFNIEKIIEVYGATEGVGGLVNQKGIPGMIGQLKVAGIMRMGEVVKYDKEKDEIIRDQQGHAKKCSLGETGMFLAKINKMNQFSGYKNNASATHEKLIENVFQKGDKYFISGDLFKLHEKDYVSFVDRLGDSFKWKGELVSTNEVGDVIFKFGNIEDANVYGVRVNNTEGRAGMAALTLLPGEELDWDRFADYLTEKLPVYALPWFVRIRDEKDATATFKQVKTNLKDEGFNPDEINDSIYFLKPDGKSYVELTRPVYEKIQSGEIRF